MNITNFTQNTDKIYNVDIEPPYNETYSIKNPSGSYTETNKTIPNVESNIFEWTRHVNPTITISYTPSDSVISLSSTNTISLNFVISDDTTDFDENSITITAPTNASTSLTTFTPTNAKQYSGSYNLIETGNYEIKVEASKFTDSFANKLNQASNIITISV